MIVFLNSQKSIDSFKLSENYKSFKRIKIDTARILPRLRSKAQSDIEGIYTNTNGTISIGIMPTQKDKFIGVALKKNNLLDVGHVLMELKRNNNGSFDCIYHTGLLAFNFNNVFTTIQIWGGRIPKFGFSKVGNTSTSGSRQFSFREIDGTIYPRKVALIFNRITGSAAEGMITYSIQSNKVITLGENSGGYVGYGNVMTVAVPCGKYLLRSTTTKYLHNSSFEFVGIEPMHKLSYNQDWIEAARTELFNRK